MDNFSISGATINTTEKNYHIPIKFRKMENLHIVFWLFKDISWCMVWRPLGIAMIFPTLIISIIIAWRTRQFMSERCHNFAITFWIDSRSYKSSVLDNSGSLFLKMYSCSSTKRLHRVWNISQLLSIVKSSGY